ncbi:glycosyltransferase [Candidatus Microgenomates bacterium]|nr:MAG: glycosyltransferase [Candidatus Microgenomates bacterium]
MKLVELSLILPCYKEEEHFSSSLDRIVAVLQGAKIRYEIILVEDKSTDNTLQLIKAYLQKHKKAPIILVEHGANRGRGRSVADGISKSTADLVGFMDIDCEIAPDYIPQFLTQLKAGYDVAYGIRHYPLTVSGMSRALASKVYSLLVRVLLATNVRDTEVGFKFFRRKKILKTLDETQDEHWFWDTEIMIRAERNGLSIVGIPVKFNRRTDKTSTVHLVSDTIEYLQKLLAFRKSITSISKQQNSFLSPFRNVMLPIHKIQRALPNEGNIYEIGSGYGSLAYALASDQPQRNVIGIDISDQKISQAKEKYFAENLSFEKQDALKFVYRKWNGLILSDFLHHISYENQEALLRTVIKHMDKQGVLIIKEIDKSNLIRSGLSRIWDWLLYPKDRIYYRSKSAWRTFLVEQGLKVTILEEVRWFPGSTVLYICSKK